MKKYIVWSFLTLLFIGCGASSSYFVLATPSTIKTYHTNALPTIGVDKISLPEYLQQNKIAIQLSPTQISYKSDIWAGDMETLLTKDLIATIQKSFNNPYVYAYPWNLSKQAGMRVKVSISRFIAYKDTIYLDANWEIYNIKTQQSFSKLFSTTVPTKPDTASVVANMSKAFAKLSTTVTQQIADKF